FNAIIEEIKEKHAHGQPALVGTISIEKSEVLSTMLKRQGVPHVVLNAKYHEREAEIVAQAGRKAAVTIATNMAGRGTDILLGGDRLMGWMERLGMEEGVPIEHGMVTRSIERAQKQVEGRNFEARKHLLEYDDVMNKQREAVYTLRRSILEGREGKEYLLNAAADIAEYLFEIHYPEDSHEPPDEPELNAELYDYFGLDLEACGVDMNTMRREEVVERIKEAVNRRYEEKESAVGADAMRLHEKYLLLQ